MVLGGECSYLVTLDVLVAVGVEDAVLSLVSYLNMHHHNFSLILSFLKVTAICNQSFELKCSNQKAMLGCYVMLCDSKRR